MTDQYGAFESEGVSKWRLWIPAPSGLPVRNHQIAIWKEGYFAFVFSQYDRSIEDFKEFVRRQDLIEAIDEIPSQPSSTTETMSARCW